MCAVHVISLWCAASDTHMVAYMGCDTHMVCMRCCACGTYFSVSLAGAVIVTANSFLSSPASNNINLPLSVPTMTLSSDTQACER